MMRVTTRTPTHARTATEPMSTEWKTRGRAHLVVISHGRETVSLQHREVEIFPDSGIVHVSDEGGGEHALTASLSATTVYWTPPRELPVADEAEPAQRDRFEDIYG
jgi:hypothetical protein